MYWWREIQIQRPSTCFSIYSTTHIIYHAKQLCQKTGRCRRALVPPSLFICVCALPLFLYFFLSPFHRSSCILPSPSHFPLRHLYSFYNCSFVWKASDWGLRRPDGTKAQCVTKTAAAGRDCNDACGWSCTGPWIQPALLSLSLSVTSDMSYSSDLWSKSFSESWQVKRLLYESLQRWFIHHPEALLGNILRTMALFSQGYERTNIKGHLLCKIHFYMFENKLCVYTTTL